MQRIQCGRAVEGVKTFGIPFSLLIPQGPVSWEENAGHHMSGAVCWESLTGEVGQGRHRVWRNKSPPLRQSPFAFECF